LTAVGDDPVGRFLLHFLQKEGVETQFVPTKPGFRTSAVLLGIEPPDRFPLVYYREGCADIQLTIDDVIAAPVGQAKALFISGTGLSREPSRSATLCAAQQASACEGTVYLDLDFRPDQWHDPRAFGAVIRSALPWVSVVLGTEDEVKAAALADASQVAVRDSQVSDTRIAGDLDAAIAMLFQAGAKTLALKRGAQGATVYEHDGNTSDVAPFPVEVVNILGAGDAFAAGLIAGRTWGWSWHKSARLGNATGAIVVTQSGCANFMPLWEEVQEFADARGGLA
jgi:5-dehydro-2-deoxygluconokinase